MKIPTYEEILPYIAKKLITEQRHPEDSSIAIFNYSQLQQFSGEWDEITRACRGLILNVKTGEVVARPFEKFFNLGEHTAKGWPIPNEEPHVYEKIDGSLGILYELKGKPWIATRGSFVSDQALWATEWWRKNVNLLPLPETTGLFEIVYPANRIVVNYDFAGLVHLGTLSNNDGALTGFEYVHMSAKKFPFSSYEDLQKMNISNAEGFVLFYPKANVRIKIKFDEYVRLHKIMTGLSEIGIWEALANGDDIIKLIGDVPDEMHGWVKGVVSNLLEKFVDIERIATQAEMEAKKLPTRREQADVITKSKYPGIAFAMLDGKDYKKGIWRLIRPVGKRSFKVDIDS